MKEVFTDMDSKDIKSEYLNGVYNEISVLLGIEAALTLHSEFRGQQINLYQAVLRPSMTEAT